MNFSNDPRINVQYVGTDISSSVAYFRHDGRIDPLSSICV